MVVPSGTQDDLWAIPLINTPGMRQGSEKVFGWGPWCAAGWRRRLEAKSPVPPHSVVIDAMGRVVIHKTWKPGELDGIK